MLRINAAILMAEASKKIQKNVAGVIGLCGVIILLIMGFIFPLWVELFPFQLTDALLQQPDLRINADYILGTDDLGRDLFARLITGTKYSLGIGFIVVLGSACIGAFLGLAAGVYGGWVDTVVMRCVDILMCLPSILLAIVMVAILGPGLVNAMIAVSIVAIPRFVRIMRSAAANEMKKQYIFAAQSIGTRKFKILWSEVLPNCWGPLIVQATLGFSDAILDIAALGFLGLGAKAPTPEWGVMLSDARPFIESEPFMVILPGLCILVTVLSFNLLGDWLRDWFDPKIRTQSS
jgi:peptide/nickel transport system permease protein/dipeptide transport system permease protein